MTKGDEVLTHKKPIPHDLNSLKDVLVASLLDNDYLGYDSATGKWKNKANVLLLDGSRAMTGDLLPNIDGRFLGETTTPRRWNGSKLIGLLSSQLTWDADSLVLRKAGCTDWKIWNEYNDLTFRHGTEDIPRLGFTNTDSSWRFNGNIYPYFAGGGDIGRDDIRFRDIFLSIKANTPLVETDTINEKTTAAGVTVGGVLCKDGALKLTLGQPLYLGGTYGGVDQKIWSLDNLNIKIQTCDVIYLHGNLVSDGQAQFNSYFMMASGFPVYFYGSSYPYGGNQFKTYDDLGNWQEIARVYGGVSDYRFEISRAGDIALLDDKFLKIGKDSDGVLPTPDASYRGKMIRVEGGAGVADKLYICMKSAADTYSWVQVASG